MADKGNGGQETGIEVYRGREHRESKKSFQWTKGIVEFFVMCNYTLIVYFERWKDRDYV